MIVNFSKLLPEFLWVRGEEREREPMNKNSNLEIHPSDSESQVLDSFDSLLIPSEPPDLKNWFSSYKYESPELNTGDGLEGFGSLRGNDSDEEGSYVEDSFKEKEENLGIFGKIGKEDEFIADEKVDSEGFIRCENSVADIGTNQVADSTDTLAFSSEPPDIKNWFSSYVYESPALDTGDEFRLSNDEESTTARVVCNIGPSTKLEEEDVWEYRKTGKIDDLVDGKITSAGLVRFNSSFEDNNNDHQNQVNHDVTGKRNSSALTDLPLKGISEQILESKRAKNSEDNLSEDVEISSLYDEDSTRMLKGKFHSEGSHRPLGVHKSSDTNEKSPRKLIHMRDFKATSSEGKAQVENGIISPRSNLDVITKNRSSSKRTDIISSAKQDDGIGFEENGFVSARKNRRRRENDENSFIRPLGTHSESLRNGVKVSSAGKNVGNLGRKALTEITNTQPSDVLGITGKWRCPQKSKPNLGPPMKQLRLERWVRHV